MATGIVAAMMPLLARHHLYDAVNVYNDNIASKQRGESPLLEPPAGDAPVGGESK